uniref:Uncharacterized protein n=1 Tax=Plectus sambesii TaxID=2011161 RepID=A0A914V1B7_9BILA
MKLLLLTFLALAVAVGSVNGFGWGLLGLGPATFPAFPQYNSYPSYQYQYPSYQYQYPSYQYPNYYQQPSNYQTNYRGLSFRRRKSHHRVLKRRQGKSSL